MTDERPAALPTRAGRAPLVDWAFLVVEHGLIVAIGAILSVTAAFSLVSIAATLWDGIRLGEGEATFLVVIDQLLFVLMLAEILHTVRVSLKSGALDAEPFLIVGLIASIRRVLVITVESSQAGPGHAPAGFMQKMIELGLLGVLILVMVTSIFMLRRARSD